MTLAYATEHRLRPTFRGVLDYDDSLIPGKIVANVLRLGDVTDKEDAELKAALKWGYGSAFGLWHGTLQAVPPRAVGQRRFRRDAHECDLHAVPRTRPNASTMAMGPWMFWRPAWGRTSPTSSPWRSWTICSSL